MEYERPTHLFFRFEDLRIYNKAIDYVSWVYNNSQFFPDNEKNGIATKFISSAQLIAVYIAEGSCRNKAQLIHYLKMAKSVIRECLVMTTICQKLNFLSDASVEESRLFLIEMTKMIGAMVASLQKFERTYDKKEDYQKEEDPKDEYMHEHLPLDPLMEL